MRLIFSGICGLFLFVACGQEEGDPGLPGDQVGKSVVCTTGMIADLARVIGGDRIAVTGLMGPGVDPHYYKASQGDLTRMTAADLLLFNGLFLEGKMEEIFEKMARGKKVLAVTGGIREDALRRPPEFAQAHPADDLTRKRRAFRAPRCRRAGSARG